MTVSIKKIKKKMTKKITKILMNDADNSDDIIQNDSNSENYWRVITEFSFKSETESKSKNNR